MLPEALDFQLRADPATLPEWMDEPCAYEELRECLRDLAQVNTVTLAHRPTLRWLAEATGSAVPGQPLYLVDVGCGGGDLLRRIERWARGRGIAIHLTGIDLNPQAIRAAREFTPPESRIRWMAGDVFSYAPLSPIDIVVSSLMTHHLSDTEIVRLLMWMESTTQRGWFINDLYRSRQAHRLFRWLAQLAGWHRFIQHDGPVSIRRSFREADWTRLCALAGLERNIVGIAAAFPARLCVGRMK